MEAIDFNALMTEAGKKAYEDSMLPEAYKADQQRRERILRLNSLGLTKRGDGTFIPNESNMVLTITDHYNAAGVSLVKIFSPEGYFLVAPQKELEVVVENSCDPHGFISNFGTSALKKSGLEFVTAMPFWLTYLQAECNMPAARMSVLRNALDIMMAAIPFVRGTAR